MIKMYLMLLKFRRWGEKINIFQLHGDTVLMNMLVLFPTENMFYNLEGNFCLSEGYFHCGDRLKRIMKIQSNEKNLFSNFPVSEGKFIIKPQNVSKNDILSMYM